VPTPALKLAAELEKGLDSGSTGELDMASVIRRGRSRLATRKRLEALSRRTQSSPRSAVNPIGRLVGVGGVISARIAS
jgi:hypothetical protein